MDRIEKDTEIFRKSFGIEPEVMVRAPGRVNLIGEHTDYNEGFVLPVGIDRDIVYLGSARKDRKVVLYSLNFNQREEFSLDFIPPRSGKWSDYPRGVLKIFSDWILSAEDRVLPFKGMNLLIEGNVPIAAGLSSSAAMEVGMAATLQKLNNLDIPSLELIKLARKAENEFVGVSCGIMDQFISCLSRKGYCLFLDCRSLEYEYIPLNLGDVKIAICNTKVKRELANTFYNKRRSECTEGLKVLQKYLPQIKSLRDVELEVFRSYEDLLPEDIRKRLRHVITENQRVLDSLKALKENNLQEFGRLLYASHESLKNLYEVSCEELDIMVNIAREIDGVTGSRMTGAGFGGCTIALVRESAVEKFIDTVYEKYFALTGIKPEIYICESQNGALQS